MTPAKPILPGTETQTEAKLSHGLFIVATPIGHAQDLTFRAKSVLQAADAILAEDTRVTRKLMAIHGIANRLVPYHDHNAVRQRPAILSRLEAGAALALVSDAGTPLVSDPGYKLVREAIARGIAVTHVPGASSLLTALVLSGLPPDRFFFGGFLPPKAGERRRVIESLKEVPATLIFFEGAARLSETLADLAQMLGPRPGALARELTKRHEEVMRMPLDALAARIEAEGPPKGEIVIVIGPPMEGSGEPDFVTLDAALLAALAQGTLKDAVEGVSIAMAAPKKMVYARALALIAAKKK